MVESETNDPMANGLRTDSSNGSATRVDDGTGLCADISARDEFVPWQERRASGVRALGENLGNEIGVVFQELKRLQDKIEQLQEKVHDATDINNSSDFNELQNRVDELENKADDIDPDDFVKEGDLDDKIRDEVMYCLTRRVNMTVKVEEN